MIILLAELILLILFFVYMDKVSLPATGGRWNLTAPGLGWGKPGLFPWPEDSAGRKRLDPGVRKGSQERPGRKVR